MKFPPAEFKKLAKS